MYRAPANLRKRRRHHRCLEQHGRATAVACAQQGARVVVAARRDAALRAVAAECERAGGSALAVTTDVQQVQHLAQQAIEQFGRIDVWVNNAAVLLFAKFHEAPPDLYRQVIETDLFGYIYGARAVLPHFRQQGSWRADQHLVGRCLLCPAVTSA